MKFIIIIPARFFSSRFPGKLLADIHGKPMIVRVVEKALETTASKIIVATDNRLIIHAIELEYGYSTHKVETCLTQTTHQSGTERISEIIQKYQFPDTQCIVQLQADEPLISSNMIQQVVQSLYLSLNNNISVATLATPIISYKQAQDNNTVKVVIDINNNALYFSRSQIPWISKNFNYLNSNLNILSHVGIYAYQASFIKQYIKWEKSPLEQLEMLEQLRVLWYGKKIKVSVVNKIFSISVNTPESLKQVNLLFQK